MPILFLKRTREDLILRILLPSLPSHPSLPRDEWVFKGQVRKQSRPNMAASWTTGFLGIVFARAGSLTYMYIYIYMQLGFFVSSALHPLRACVPWPRRRGGATPTLVITAARSPRGWPRFHVSRTCQLGVTTRRDLCFIIPLLPRLLSPIFTVITGGCNMNERSFERFIELDSIPFRFSREKNINLPFL